MLAAGAAERSSDLCRELAADGVDRIIG